MADEAFPPGPQTYEFSKNICTLFLFYLSTRALLAGYRIGPSGPFFGSPLNKGSRIFCCGDDKIFENMIEVSESVGALIFRRQGCMGANLQRLGISFMLLIKINYFYRLILIKTLSLLKEFFVGSQIQCP